MLHGSVARLEIAHEPPEKAHICSLYAVVVVKVHCGKSADVYLKYVVAPYMLVDERRIQAMYAFDYKRLVGVELENAPVFFAAARHKVENGHFCFFAGRKRYEIAPQPGNVTSVHMVTILLAVFNDG